MRPVLVPRPWAGHADHSGHSQLVPLIVARGGRVLRPRGLLLVAACARSLRDPRAVVHVLYGEDHFHPIRHLGRLGQRRRGALVATFHHPPGWHVVDGQRSLRAATLCEAVVVLCAEQARQAATVVDPDRVHVVAGGVDSAFWTPAEGVGHGPDELVCLAVGSHLRDSDLLAATWSVVRIHRPLARLLVVGAGPHTGALERVGGVELLGRVTDEELRRLYRTATALLHPVAAVTWNNATAEALACGLPVVASTREGAFDHVDEQVGVLCEPDPHALAGAVIELHEDRARRDVLSRAAVERRRSWDAVADDYLRVYAHALTLR